MFDLVCNWWKNQKDSITKNHGRNSVTYEARILHVSKRTNIEYVSSTESDTSI